MRTRMWIVSAAIALTTISSGANATLITKDFTLTASSFINFNGDPAPFKSLLLTFNATYDDSVSGYLSSPTSFTAITDGSVNTGPFADPAYFWFIQANPTMGTPNRAGLRGSKTIANGGLLSDFDFSFPADGNGARAAMLAFVDGRSAFLATDASVTSVQSVAPAVPEPATWAMLLTGFTGIGWAMRRKPRQVSIPSA